MIYDDVCRDRGCDPLAEVRNRTFLSDLAVALEKEFAQAVGAELSRNINTQMKVLAARSR